MEQIMKTKQEVIDYINTLQGYEGYVQFSHRPIDKDQDIFCDGKLLHVSDDKDGFVYEAHFYNGEKSISIRQINDAWLISKTDISNVPAEDKETYISAIKGFQYDVKMAQIWEEVEDELCAGMKVKKLKKVVFAGFVKEGDEK
jgi:CRISPR type III-associated protein (TIGR04423 family)